MIPTPHLSSCRGRQTPSQGKEWVGPFSQTGPQPSCRSRAARCHSTCSWLCRPLAHGQASQALPGGLFVSTSGPDRYRSALARRSAVGRCCVMRRSLTLTALGAAGLLRLDAVSRPDTGRFRGGLEIYAAGRARTAAAFVDLAAALRARGLTCTHQTRTSGSPTRQLPAPTHVARLLVSREVPRLLARCDGARFVHCKLARRSCSRLRRFGVPLVVFLCDSLSTERVQQHLSADERTDQVKCTCRRATDGGLCCKRGQEARQTHGHVHRHDRGANSFATLVVGRQARPIVNAASPILRWL